MLRITFVLAALFCASYVALILAHVANVGFEALTLNYCLGSFGITVAILNIVLGIASAYDAWIRS